MSEETNFVVVLEFLCMNFNNMERDFFSKRSNNYSTYIGFCKAIVL
jgi:hypothetical protein